MAGKVKMPIYEYLCHKGHKFELRQEIGGTSPVKCPLCGSEATQLISRVNLPKNAGIWLFERTKDGIRELLHD